MDGTDNMLCNGSEEGGDVRSVCVRKMKALPVSMVVVILIEEGR